LKKIEVRDVIILHEKQNIINMDIQELPVMPFGKYNGQPITTVIADTKYVEWIKNQPNMEKQYPTIFNILVHQQMPNKSSKTPVHNLLQNKFLNRDVQIVLLKKIFPKTLVENPTTYLMKLEKLFKNEEFIDCFGNHEIPEEDKNYLETQKLSVVFESDFNWDIKLTTEKLFNMPSFEYKKCKVFNTNIIDIKNEIRGILKNFKEDTPHIILNGEYKFHNEESKLFLKIVTKNFNCIETFIELKPILGDDYPEVLRKMKTQITLTKNKYKQDFKNCRAENSPIHAWWCQCCLIVGKFESRTTTEEQLIEIFGQTNIKVIFTRDLFEDDKITYTRSEMKSIEPESVISTLKSENSMLLQKLNEAETKNMTLENQIASLKKTQKTQITAFFKPK